MTSLLLLLTNCAPKQPAVEVVPPQAAIVRPPCTPGTALMLPIPALPTLPVELSEAAALDAWIDDMTAYQKMRLQTGALQDFIKTSCQ